MKERYRPNKPIRMNATQYFEKHRHPEIVLMSKEEAIRFAEEYKDYVIAQSNKQKTKNMKSNPLIEFLSICFTN